MIIFQHSRVLFYFQKKSSNDVEMSEYPWRNFLVTGTRWARWTWRRSRRAKRRTVPPTPFEPSVEDKQPMILAPSPSFRHPPHCWKTLVFQLIHLKNESELSSHFLLEPSYFIIFLYKVNHFHCIALLILFDCDLPTSKNRDKISILAL